MDPISPSLLHVIESLAAVCQPRSAEVTWKVFWISDEELLLAFGATILAGDGGPTSEFRLKWQEFIQALSRGLSNSHKVAAHSLKLHIAIMQAWDK